LVILSLSEHLMRDGDADRIAQLPRSLPDSASKCLSDQDQIISSVPVVDAHAEASVIYSGVSIAPEALKTVLEPFIQAARGAMAMGASVVFAPLTRTFNAAGVMVIPLLRNRSSRKRAATNGAGRGRSAIHPRGRHG